MRINKLVLVCLLLIGFLNAEAAETYLLVGGSGWKKIVIFEQSTKKQIWSHELEPGQECNSVAMTKNGEVLYSYRGGAKLVTLNHEVVWDYKSGKNTELQLATVLPDGGFLLGICGSPAKVIELDKHGQVRKEISYETNIQHPHSQFRTISKIKNGNYILPLWETEELIELDPAGKVVNKTKVNAAVFSTLELKDGNLLASAGDSHQYFSVNRKTGVVGERIMQKDIAGISFLFVAQIRERENGNRIICNWYGHNRETGVNEPQMVEIDKNRNIVWSLNDKANFDKISSVWIVRKSKAFNKLIEKK